jgi:hypothetical protein
MDDWDTVVQLNVHRFYHEGKHSPKWIFKLNSASAMAESWHLKWVNVYAQG